MIKLVSTVDKVLGPILGYIDVIKVVLDVGTELGSLNGYLGGSDDGKF